MHAMLSLLLGSNLRLQLACPEPAWMASLRCRCGLPSNGTTLSPAAEKNCHGLLQRRSKLCVGIEAADRYAATSKPHAYVYTL